MNQILHTLINSPGSISDWAMVLMTSVTAVFLYKTLRSQQKVQAAQNTLLAIEQLRIREEFKPKLRYGAIQDGAMIRATVAVRDNELVSIGVVNQGEQPALDFKVLPKTVKGAELANRVLICESLNNRDGHFGLHFLASRTIGRMLTYDIHCTVSYHDAAGNLYHQKLRWQKFEDASEDLKAMIAEYLPPNSKK
jgi:hypothetical protein